uniref:Uncharacterized protein n=1 Tax=Mycena chlorophos TaxID=658473 RepID=A0ABQ0KWC4_MYCCL|nr:predicted protein [Mycena chlorophos]
MRLLGIQLHTRSTKTRMGVAQNGGQGRATAGTDAAGGIKVDRGERCSSSDAVDGVVGVGVVVGGAGIVVSNGGNELYT